MRLGIIIIFLELLLLNNDIFANALLKQIDDQFKQAKYDLVLKSLAKIPKTKENNSLIYYYKGLIANRREEYSQGAKYLSQSLKYGNSFKDVHYEMGQAYYALNELDKSKAAFKRSLESNIKSSVSQYYLAHINQISEEYEEAIKFYKLLLESDTAEINLKQIAKFQIAECSYSEIEKTTNDRDDIKEKVISVMEESINLIPNSEVATEISKRIVELQNKYKLNPNILINGKPAPQATILRFTQSMSYDDNVSYSFELPTVLSTQQDSFVFNTNFDYMKNFVFDQWFILKPRLSFTYVKHSNSDNEEVYQFDQLTAIPELAASFEYELFNAPSNFNFFTNHNLTMRDWTRQRVLRTAGNSLTYGFDTSFKLLKSGNTTLRYTSTDLISYDSNLNSETTSFSLSQTFSLSRFSLLVLSYTNRAAIVETDTYNANSTILGLDYLLIERIPSVNLQFGFMFNQQNLINDSERGTELTLTGTLRASKKITDHLRYTVAYSYENRDSGNESFKFKKEAINFELKLNY